jgi:hypothetical protein
VREGFGTPADEGAARAWYEAGLAALARNEPPAVLPSQTIQRTAIIRSAINAGAQQAAAPAAPTIEPVVNRAIAPLVLDRN